MSIASLITGTIGIILGLVIIVLTVINNSSINLLSYIFLICLGICFILISMAMVYGSLRNTEI